MSACEIKRVRDHEIVAAEAFETHSLGIVGYVDPIRPFADVDAAERAAVDADIDVDPPDLCGVEVDRRRPS